MSGFIVHKVIIYKECSISIRKNLEPGEYCFTHGEGTTLYGKNLSVGAIVGMNGSGKSSLLELIFRMINNFSACLFKKSQRPVSDRLLLLGGLHADLDYSIRGKHYTLSCRDAAVALKSESFKICMGLRKRHYFPGYNDSESFIEKNIIDITSQFFYSIVVNYSMQSYVSSDYNDVCYSYNESSHKWIPSRNEVWVDGLFHKNDGYMTPIVLNPYRDSGTIDMANEMSLTMYRMSAILYEFKRMGKEYIDNYSLSHIEYRYCPEKIIRYFSDISYKESYEDKFKRITNSFRTCCQEGANSLANIILKHYRIDLSAKDEISLIARLYLVCKVIGVAIRYPSFQKYRAIANYNYVLDPNLSTEQVRLGKQLAKQLKNDRSHLSMKILQTYGFIKSYDNYKGKMDFKLVYNYDDYCKELNLNQKKHSIYDRVTRLPPSFFKSEIYLQKSVNDKTAEVNFRHLSSGERQLIFTTSSAIYHILNLRSIRKGRPMYRNFFLVFDEIEICFHPEYQRTFLSRFIDLLNNTGALNLCNVNILMTTHSPFILSDLLKDNVLYLQNGAPYDSCEVRNTFAANVNDILRQDFFMNNGFIGEIAQKKIKRLVSFLTNEPTHGDSTYDMGLASNLIELVGDPFLKQQLTILYNNYVARYCWDDCLRKKRIQALETELNKLKAMEK